MPHRKRIYNTSQKTNQQYITGDESTIPHRRQINNTSQKTNQYEIPSYSWWWWASAALMIAHCLQRLSDIKSMLVPISLSWLLPPEQVFCNGINVEVPRKHGTSIQCCFNAELPSQTVARQWIDFSCFLCNYSPLWQDITRSPPGPPGSCGLSSFLDGPHGRLPSYSPWQPLDITPRVSCQSSNDVRCCPGDMTMTWRPSPITPPMVNTLMAFNIKDRWPHSTQISFYILNCTVMSKIISCHCFWICGRIFVFFSSYPRSHHGRMYSCHYCIQL